MNRRVASVPVLALALLLLTPEAPLGAVTERQVDAACADSREAHAAYKEATSEFVEAAEALEVANVRLDRAEAKATRIEGQFEVRKTEHAATTELANEQAAELYMHGVAGSSAVLSLTTPAQAVSVMEILSTGSTESFAALDDLAAGASELDRLGVELAGAVDDLTGLRDAQAETTTAQEEAMAAASAAYEQLSDECRELQAQYQAEQARKAAEAEARRLRESQDRSGGGSTTVGGLICPFTPGRTNFINSWGAPRSGGRRHKGADMFAPLNEPVYAVASGTVSIANGGLGGKTIWLRTGGASFYYAHLNDWAVGNGQRVEQGQLIAYNGNTGNARGSSPHVHFQIHPSGRGAINPYPTVASVCF